MYSFKFDRMIRAQLPESKIAHFYSDICIPGKTAQTFYEDTKKLGVDFIYSTKHEITNNGKGLLVNYQNGTDSNTPWPADMVILLPVMGSSYDTKKFADMLNIPLDEKGFFAEEHQLLSPIASAVEGIYVIGCARGPQSIAESIVQAEASAGKILSSLVLDKKLKLEAKTCSISNVFCTGCQTCLDVCPYGAINYNEVKRICVVNEALCHGCGNCAAACPSGAAKLKHFTSRQLYQEVTGLLRQ
jgi:heterodisulfide reductase subunit A